MRVCGQYVLVAPSGESKKSKSYPKENSPYVRFGKPFSVYNRPPANLVKIWSNNRSVCEVLVRLVIYLGAHQLSESTNGWLRVCYEQLGVWCYLKFMPLDYFPSPLARFGDYSFSRSAKLPTELYILLALISIFLILKIETNYLRIHWSDFRDLCTK